MSWTADGKERNKVFPRKVRVGMEVGCGKKKKKKNLTDQLAALIKILLYTG